MTVIRPIRLSRLTRRESRDLWQCRRCGAVIVITEDVTHIAWHDLTDPPTEERNRG